MKDAQGQYLQGYNAQLVVEASTQRSQLILSARLTNDCNDRCALAEALKGVPESLRKEITHVVARYRLRQRRFDCASVEKNLSLTVLCPPQSETAPPSPKNYRLTIIQQQRRALTEGMRERLKQPEAKQIYRRRSASVEPVFGVLKNGLGFRRFRLFGLVGAQIELTLLAIAYNLRHRAQQATLATA